MCIRMAQNDNKTRDIGRDKIDYDVDKRFAHIRVEVLGQEYTDVVRVREKFPGLPEGVTVTIGHIGAVDLEDTSGEGHPAEHLQCTGCRMHPTYALIDGEGFLVCHCTHVDGSMDPWPVHGFHGHPERWEFYMGGADE